MEDNFSEQRTTTEARYWQDYSLKGVMTRSVLYPFPFPRGNGLVATDFIPKKTAFITCPLSLIMAKCNSSQTNKNIRQIPKQLSDELDDSYIYLLDQAVRQKLLNNSNWLNITSKGLIKFSQNIIHQTKDQILLEKYQQEKKKIQRYSDLYYSSLAQNSIVGNFSQQSCKEAFIEAYIVISNRSFNILSEVSMLPLIDCANHSRTDYNMDIMGINIYFQNYPTKYYEWAQKMKDRFPESSVEKYLINKNRINLSDVKLQNEAQIQQLLQNYSPDRFNIIHTPMTHIIAYSLRQIEVGEEVLMSYGNKSNLQFLINYGFAEQFNKNEKIQLYVNEDGLFYNRVDYCTQYYLNNQYQDLLNLGRRLSNFNSEQQGDQHIVNKLLQILQNNPYEPELVQHSNQDQFDQVKYLNIYLLNKKRVYLECLQRLRDIKQALEKQK